MTYFYVFDFLANYCLKFFVLEIALLCDVGETISRFLSSFHLLLHRLCDSFCSFNVFLAQEEPKVLQFRVIAIYHFKLPQYSLFAFLIG